jgi:hypothetical protein
VEVAGLDEEGAKTVAGRKEAGFIENAVGGQVDLFVDVADLTVMEVKGCVIELVGGVFENTTHHSSHLMSGSEQLDDFGAGVTADRVGEVESEVGDQIADKIAG